MDLNFSDSIELLIGVGVAYGALLWLSMVVWAFRDIRDRTQDAFTQMVATLLVLIFSLPGLLLYLILRPRETLAEAYERSLEEEAILQELEDQRACPNCKRRVQEEFVICPFCTYQLKEPCSGCGKPLSYAWAACPFCATPRSSPAESAGALSETSERAPRPSFTFEVGPESR